MATQWLGPGLGSSHAGQGSRRRISPPTLEQASGTSAVQGQVLDGESGLPIRQAQVRASLIESQASWVVRTNVNGRYELTGLPAGRYNLGAAKAGYVGLQFGQRWPRDQATTIELLDHQVLEHVDYRLPKSGVIAGRILDEFADPQPDALVVALQSRLANGRRVAVPAGRSSTTNDRGEFRISGLTPGRYYVSARSRGQPDVPASDAQAAFGYVTTYYPGTGNPDEAQLLTIGMGQELEGISFVLAPTRMFRITGTLRSERGDVPSRSALTLTNAHGLVPAVESDARTRVDGSFSLDAAPGEYVLNVRASASDSALVAQEQFASVALTVADSDVGVDIVTVKGATLRGEVSLDRPGAPPFDPARLSVLAVPVSGEVGLGPLSSSPVQGDWSFALRGLIGSQLFSVHGLPTGWELKTVLLNGQDVIDTPLRFTGTEELSNLKLTVTDRLTRLSGSVAAVEKAPLTNVSVLVFAEDHRLWALPPRYIRLARADADGRFEIRGLPPGRYLAIAARDLTSEDGQDPQVLERLRPEAVRVSLAEAEATSVVLAVSERR